jgi:hypothetical protein
MNARLRCFAVIVACATSFVACTGTRTSPLPAGAIAESVHPAAQQAGYRMRHAAPLGDVVVWKPCTHNGDSCECGYSNGESKPGVYACVHAAGLSFGIAISRRLALADGNLLYGGFGKTVVVFKGTKKVATLTGLTGEPIGLAVDRAGSVWATNSPSYTISEFAKGATKPTATYADANLTSASYLAVDATGDVYVEGQAAEGIEVDVLPAGGSTFTPISQPGKVGLTAGGLAVQSSSRATHMWINDQGTASKAAAISRYLLKGGSLYLQGSFGYGGVNGAIWADPAGASIARVWAVNNVPYGSGFNTSAIEYAMPSGKIVAATPPTTMSAQAVGVAGTMK